MPPVGKSFRKRESRSKPQGIVEAAGWYVSRIDGNSRAADNLGVSWCPTFGGQVTRASVVPHWLKASLLFR